MPNPSQSSRLQPLDALRGLLMALMALDHTSQFVAQRHSSGEIWGGSFPVYRDPLAFVTRLVTHPCAPGFAFLMGAGMLLFARSRETQGWTRFAIVRHFALRGVVLIALKFLVINRAWELSPGGWGFDVYVGVLFSLGAGMILGSLLLWLKSWQCIVLSAGLTGLVEWLTPDPSSWLRPVGLVPRLLYLPGGDSRLWVNYPILPWLAVIALGMAFGQWLLPDPARAFRRSLWLGMALLVVFVPLRYLNGFGNIRTRQGNDLVSFLNVVKYPPSATFLLLTLGVNLLLLAMLASVSAKHAGWLRPLLVFGRVPLFFYVTHLFLYAAMGRLLTPQGTSVTGMYPYWLLGLLLLYPLCLSYGHLRERQPAASWLRLF